MRALSMAVFIFILSLSLSAVKEAYGLPHGGPMWSVDSKRLQEVATVEQDQSLSGYNVFRVLVNSVQALVDIIAGAALLGSTLQAFVPFPLPNVLSTGLNVLGSTSALIALAQFVRGVGTRVMD